jgi:hypothetical protein
MVRTVLVSMAAALAACGAAVPPVPGRGGPQWIELQSPHFTVWTDADPASVRESIDKMERLREVLVRVVFPTAPAAGRALVIAVRDDAELRAFSATGEPRAFAMAPQFPLWQPMMVLSAYSGRAHDVTTAHELTHVISFGVVHDQPRWLSEGMAAYFETMGLDADRTTIDIGVAPAMTARSGKVARLVPIATLFQWSSVSSDECDLYLTARALFTYLINAHGKEFVQFLRLLERDDRIEHDKDLVQFLRPDHDERSEQRVARLWAAAFPSLPLDAIDRALENWLLTGTHFELRTKISTAAAPLTWRSLGDADVHAIRGLLRHREQPAQARRDVAAALALEPMNVLARLLSVALDRGEILVDDARALAAAHQDDWRAWLLVALAVGKARGSDAEIDAARRTACGLMTANPALPMLKLCDPR